MLNLVVDYILVVVPWLLVVIVCSCPNSEDFTIELNQDSKHGSQRVLLSEYPTIAIIVVILMSLAEVILVKYNTTRIFAYITVSRITILLSRALSLHKSSSRRIKFIEYGGKIIALIITGAYFV